ncbi:MAG: hypothetical protein ACJARR_004089 [Pseudophaeobacter arcticus]|jgi:hypothetical protein
MTPSKRTALYLHSAAGRDKAISSQRACCRDFVDQSGWNLASEYIDNGISSSLKERPACRVGCPR